MKLLKVDTPKIIKEKIINYFSEIKIGYELINVKDSHDRYLYEDIESYISLPEYRKSTVDGYAVVAKDTFGTSENMPVFLNLVGNIKMGEETNLLIEEGSTAYVPTGGMVPNGANAMVMIEHTEKLDDNTIVINKPSVPNENVVQIGEDIKKSETILKRGRKIRPQDIGALCAIGITKIKVFKRPIVTIISTGDEIISPEEDKIKKGQTRDINSYTIKALVEEYGGLVIDSLIVKDDYNELRQTVQKAMDKSHLIILSGGSSVGIKDNTAKILNSFGKPGVFVHGAAVKPGKPTIMSYAKETAMVGLPGHPVSAVIIFKIFGKLIFDTLLNKQDIIETKINAICTKNIHASPGRETYQMVKINKTNGKYNVEPIFAKSAIISSLTKADGYIKIGINDEGIKKGNEVEVYLL